MKIENVIYHSPYQIKNLIRQIEKLHRTIINNNYSQVFNKARIIKYYCHYISVYIYTAIKNMTVCTFIVKYSTKCIVLYCTYLELAKGRYRVYYWNNADLID